MSDVEEKSGAESGGLVRRRRRRWSEAQKRQIVAETLEPGVSVLMVAQRYKVSANQVFAWRRLFREPARDTGIDGFVPVVVGAAPGHEGNPPLRTACLAWRDSGRVIDRGWPPYWCPSAD